MPIVNASQPGLNATFWGLNPYFSSLIEILSRRGVNVEPIQTEAGKSFISVGTPSIVVFRGKKEEDESISETDIRDLRMSYEPDKKLAKIRTKPTPPEKFTRVSQISKFAASYLRAFGYGVDVSVVNPNELIDLDLNSGQIRFDKVDLAKIDPVVLKKELGLDY